jgi:AraC family L-rhamnose operon regulatory protein RhaS
VEWDETGICLLESHHAPDFRMDWRRDPFPKVLFFLKGSGHLFLEHRPGIEISAPGITCLPAGCVHFLQDAAGEPLHIFVLCLHPLRYAFAALAESVCSRVQFVAGLLDEADTVTRLRRIHFEQTKRSPGRTEALSIESGQLLINLLRAEPGSGSVRDARERVRAYTAALHQTFFFPDTLDDIAARVGLSRRRFSTLFRELNGESWQRYQRQLRIRHACELLRNGRETVSDIAFCCGFADLSHFYRAFRTETGRTPLAYRKKRD